MTPSHPGDFVRTEIIEELGLDLVQAAEILGVRRTALSELLNADAALSPEMALRIEKAFDISMDMLLRMQPGTTRRECGPGQTKSTSIATNPSEVCFIYLVGGRVADRGHRPRPYVSSRIEYGDG